MPRDYKTNKPRIPAKKPPSGGSGNFMAGLLLGLLVAGGVFVYERQSQPRVAPVTTSRDTTAATPRTDKSKPSDSRTAAGTQSSTPDASTAKPAPAKPKPVVAAQPADPQFDFYEMLPKFEVVIPEQDESTPAQNRSASMQKGVYILQAGSFRNSEDAERVRALIALQGVQSKVQRVTIDRDTWHRVRIGPITDLNKLEDTRSRLRQAQIEALVIRVGG